MADFGYDITDYTGIEPLFGVMDDFDRLLTRAHECGLKVVLDFVPNHTSDHLTYHDDPPCREPESSFGIAGPWAICCARPMFLDGLLAGSDLPLKISSTGS